MTRKLSGQTLTIIILAILLIFVSVCGGVYAYYSYRSNRISGFVTLGNLKISMYADNEQGESGSSEIIMTNSLVVPGQSLENSALTIFNTSNVDIYLVAVYSVQVSELDDPEAIVDISNTNQILDIGNDAWTHYRYVDTDETNPADVRCFINLTPVVPEQSDIVLIAKNQLKLHGSSVKNEFQGKRISFTFQAYAIAYNSFYDIPNFENLPDEEKCFYIMDRLHESVRWNFDA